MIESVAGSAAQAVVPLSGWLRGWLVTGKTHNTHN